MHLQHEIVKKHPLLDEKGNLLEAGFAKTLILPYDRSAVKASKLRIKEWDYYYIGDNERGLCLTISDVGYVASHSVSLLGFTGEPFQYNDSELGFFPKGKVGLPATSVKGDVSVKQGRIQMSFLNDGKKRRLFGTFKNFCHTKKTLSFDVTLTDIPKESMVIATPFTKPKHFYYNQKINAMRADGYVEFDGEKHFFNEENRSLGTLDWGRGVWTYDNTWYWGSGQVLLPSGDRFGFNVGYGFGDTTAATENMLFFNGKAHKISEVTFQIPKDEKGNYRYTEPWKLTSDDGRFTMDFLPIIDRQAPLDVGVLKMIPHQVFGRLTGQAVLDDKTVIEIKDETCFFEHVHNKW